MNVQPYLMFDGRCEEAIAFYRGALGAEVGNVHHLGGVEDVGAWSDSAWAGRPFAHLDEPVETRGCVSCHMAEEAGVASHRRYEQAHRHPALKD